jgi:TATA-box binding protein (TBP) (component of TFIID and TFIIIB)
MDVFTNFVTKGREFEQTMTTCLTSLGGRITTITSFAKFDKYPVVISATEVSSPEGKKRKRMAFYNAKTFRHGTVSVKVFRTGLHVTGCKSFEDVTKTLTTLTNILPTQIDVQLVNILVNFNQPLHLHALCDAFKKHYDCLYDRETYCGLRIKVPSIIADKAKTTILLFPSGKAMITGLRHSEDIQHIHQHILDPIKNKVTE